MKPPRLAMRGRRVARAAPAAAVTARAPHVRGRWSGERIAVVFILALLPPLAEAILRTGPRPLEVLGVAVLAAFGWQALFARWRGRALTAWGLVTAMAVATMVPPATPWWQVALAVSFGTVVGEQVFGGTGRNFLNPAAVALAFLIFSFPDAAEARPVAVSWVAVVPGALVLLAAGLVPWRVMAGGVLGAGALAVIAGADPVAQVAAGGFAFALVFLACDPVAGAATRAGRWLHGLLVGALAVIGAAGAAGSMKAVVFAVLIGGVFAPLIDEAAIACRLAWRRRRHG